MTSSKNFKALVRAHQRLTPGSTYRWCLQDVLKNGVSEEIRAEALRWRRLSVEDRKKEEG